MPGSLQRATLLMGKMEQNGRQVRMDSWAEMSQHLSEPATEITSWLPQRPRLVGGRKKEGGEEAAQPDASETVNPWVPVQIRL